MNPFARTELLLGKEALEKLSLSRVAVFGIGGVGGYVVEALIRSGIGAMDLIDSDVVDVTNLNRQIIATVHTIGQYKVDAARDRCLSINPLARITTHHLFYLPETAAQFDFADYDYVVDAVDTVTAKLDLIERAVRTGVPVISSMGAGNKMDPSAFEIADISKTSVCPLARVMRRELKKRGIEHITVVYSKEPAMTPIDAEPTDFADPASAGSAPICASSAPLSAASTASAAGKMRRTPGSNAFVPAAAGLLIASQVVRDLIG